MSVSFEGNAFIDGGIIQNVLSTNTTISNSSISTSSINMIDNVGNFQNIINVKDPILDQDAATKKYVDNLTIFVSNIYLSNTNSVTILNELYGSRTIYITNIVTGGPSAIFMISKNSASKKPQINRINSCRGNNSSVILQILWEIQTGITLNKSDSLYDGMYNVKIV
jgi:hypothetical protein